MKHRHPKSAFLTNDMSFLQLEDELKKHRGWAEDVWERRVSFALCLGKSAHTPKERRFRWGIFCYLAWMFFQVRKASAIHQAVHIPDADFLIYIVGNVSVEVDTLVPIARALHDSGNSVVVVFGSGDVLPMEIASQLHGIPVTLISPESFLGSLNGCFFAAAVQSIWTMAKAFVCLLPLAGCLEAFWNRGVWQLHNMLQFQASEHFWSGALLKSTFRGVAVASEFAPTAGALCKVAKRNSWRSHHFLHGLPGIHLTRGIASNIYCYSSVDRNMFLQNGWSETTAHALGHPRQCMLVPQIQKARNLGHYKSRLRLLFASQPPSPGEYATDEYQRTVAAMVRAGRELMLTAGHFRIRLHPVETKEQFVGAHGSSVPEELFSRRSISEDLAWANVVVTAFSTVAIEAAYAGCFVIWLEMGKFRYEIRERLIAEGYGRKVTTADDLRVTLSACRDPVYLAERLQQQQRAARDQHILNPLAASDSAALMITEPRRHALPSCPNR